MVWQDLFRKGIRGTRTGKDVYHSVTLFSKYGKHLQSDMSSNFFLNARYICDLPWKILICGFILNAEQKALYRYGLNGIQALIALKKTLSNERTNAAK